MSHANATLICTSVGGGLYWAASALFLTVWRPTQNQGQSDYLLQALIWLAIAVFVGVLFAIHRPLSKPRGRFILAIAGLAAAIVYAAICIASAQLSADSLRAAAFIANTCHHALLITFWGIAFALSSKRDAMRCVAFSILIAGVVYLLASAVPIGNFGPAASALMRALGVIPFLALWRPSQKPTHFQGVVSPDAHPFSYIERNETVPQSAMHPGPSMPSAVSTALLPFYLSRAVLGICMAPLFFVAAQTAMPATHAGACIVGCAAVCLACAAFAKGKLMPSDLLRTAPFLLIAIAVLPFCGPLSLEADTLKTVAAAIVWLCWISLSSAQISEMKERLRIEASTLAISEKAIVLISVFIGYAACALIQATTQSPLGSVAPFPSVIAPAFMGVALCSHLFSRFIDEKGRQSVANKALFEPELQIIAACDKIARTYSLTEREKDVFVLLAKGYARSRIREQLHISDGTVKTHAYHIYDKLGIHSKEELQELVEKTRRQNAREQAQLNAPTL